MRTARTSVALFLFWCVVVPPRTIADVLVGVVVAALLATWAVRFLWHDAEVRAVRVRWSRLPRFVWTLSGRIVVAAAQVLAIVLDPRLPIAPVMRTHVADLGSEAARVVYANAITLTPGTLTVDVDGDVYRVHCLDERLARRVLDGSLARHVADVFGSEPRS